MDGGYLIIDFCKNNFYINLSSKVVISHTLGFDNKMTVQ